jgi:hypothetical protein
MIIRGVLAYPLESAQLTLAVVDCCPRRPDLKWLTFTEGLQHDNTENKSKPETKEAKAKPYARPQGHRRQWGKIQIFRFTCEFHDADLACNSFTLTPVGHVYLGSTCCCLRTARVVLVLYCSLTTALEPSLHGVPRVSGPPLVPMQAGQWTAGLSAVFVANSTLRGASNSVPSFASA